MSGGILSDDERTALLETLHVRGCDVPLHLKEFRTPDVYHTGDQVEYEGFAYRAIRHTLYNTPFSRENFDVLGQVIAIAGPEFGGCVPKWVRPMWYVMKPEIFDMGLDSPMLKTDGRNIPPLTELMIFANTEVVLGKIEKLLEKLGVDINPETKVALADFREDIAGDIGAVDVNALVGELDNLALNGVLGRSTIFQVSKRPAQLKVVKLDEDKFNAAINNIKSMLGQ